MNAEIAAKKEGEFSNDWMVAPPLRVKQRLRNVGPFFWQGDRSMPWLIACEKESAMPCDARRTVEENGIIKGAPIHQPRPDEKYRQLVAAELHQLLKLGNKSKTAKVRPLKKHDS